MSYERTLCIREPARQFAANSLKTISYRQVSRWRYSCKPSHAGGVSSSVSKAKSMPGDPTMLASDWRNVLPTLTGRSVTLREVASADLRPLVDVLSLGDAT